MKRRMITRERALERNEPAHALLILAALLALLLASLPAAAESEAETFRGELLEAVGLLGEAVESVPALAETGRVAELEKRVLALDPEALRQLSRRARAEGSWPSALDRLRQAADELRLAEPLGGSGAAEGDGDPDYSSACGNDRPSIGSMQAALLIAEVFEGLEIIAQTACDSAPSGDFEQLNVVFCPPAGVAGEARLISESVYENYALCSDDIDSAEITATYELADRIDGTVGENLDEQVSTRASQDSLDDHAADVDAELLTIEAQLSMLQGDVSGLGASVANVQAELDDVQVRVTDTQLGVDDLETRVSDVEQSVDDLRIEVQDLADATSALAATLDDFVDSSQSFEALNLQILIEGDLERKGAAAVSLFQLPAAYGGYLELAREIVITTIEANQAAGQSVGDASELVSEGDGLFNAGAYRDAYQLYREAYHQATGR